MRNVTLSRARGATAAYHPRARAQSPGRNRFGLRPRSRPFNAKAPTPARSATCLLAVCLLLAACSGGAVEGSTTTSSPAVTTTSAVTSTANLVTTTSPITSTIEAGPGEAQLLQPGQYAPDANPLAAGAYTTDTPGVTVTFTISEGWSVFNVETLGIGLQPPESPPGAFISINRFSGEVFEDPCGAKTTTDIGVDAAALIAWLVAHENLDLAGPETVMVGGHEGSRVNGTPTIPSGCDPMSLLPLPVVEEYQVFPGTTLDLTVVEVDGMVILLTSESATEGWDEMNTISDSFFGSIEIGT